MIKVLVASKYVYQVENVFDPKTGDTITTLTNGNGIPSPIAVTIIRSYGGIMNLLQHCEDTDKTLDEFIHERGKRKALSMEEFIENKKRIEEINKKINKKNNIDYFHIETSERPVECNPANICIILRFLNRMYPKFWGELPKMNIGYKVNHKIKIDRKGIYTKEHYTTMELEEPIIFRGEYCRFFTFNHRNFYENNNLYLNVYGEDGIREYEPNDIY